MIITAARKLPFAAVKNQNMSRIISVHQAQITGMVPIKEAIMSSGTPITGLMSV